MRRTLARLLLAAAVTGCGDDGPTSFTYDLGDVQPAPATAPQPAPVPADEHVEDEGEMTFGDDDGPPPVPRTVEPRRAGHVRLLVLSGGGYHEFPANLARLLPAVEQRLPSVSITELALHPADLAGPTSRQLLEEADLAAEFDAVLAYTQGDVALTETMKSKLLAFVHGGGGLVALHCAADSHPGWAGWDDLLRGRFESHPPYQDVMVSIVLQGHPVVDGLPRDWVIKDEFYHLKDCATDDKLVLMSGTSPEGGATRPVTWVRDAGKGRVMYTILGHGADTHGDARYQQLVAQAVWWAAGWTEPWPARAR